MFEISKTETFIKWFYGLRDETAKIKVRLCIDRAVIGNFGDHRAVGEGVSEMRINYGPDIACIGQCADKRLFCCLPAELNQVRTAI